MATIPTGAGNFTVIPTPNGAVGSSGDQASIDSSFNFVADVDQNSDNLVFTLTPGDTVGLTFSIDFGGATGVVDFDVTSTVVRSDLAGGPVTNIDTVVLSTVIDFQDGNGPVPTSVIWTPFEPLPPNTNFITGLDADPATEVVFPCFARGTQIQAGESAVSVEDIEPGDLITTRDHGLVAVKWVGSATRSIDATSAPIRITAGALGNETDLLVSPQHRMLLTDWRAEMMFGEAEVLAKAKDLINGDTIYQDMRGESVEYFHILFDDHEIIFAEGAPTESLNPGKAALEGMAPDTVAELLELFPQLAEENGVGPDARLSLKAHEVQALIER